MRESCRRGLKTEFEYVIENGPGKEPTSVVSGETHQGVVCRHVWGNLGRLHAGSSLQSFSEVARVGGGHDLGGEIS